MPELPAIAILKKYVDSTTLGKKITKVEFPETGLLQAPKKYFEGLKGTSLSTSRQLGKYLFLKAQEKLWLGFHFGMTGNLVYYQNQDPPKYTHLLLTFEDSSHLAFTCRRKLGKIYITEGVELFQKEHSLGTHALDVELEEFLKLLTGKKGMIKMILMDQHLLSGIGNVYADEMLYQSGIHPKTGADSVSEAEKKKLFQQMKEVMTTAIKNDAVRAKLPADYLTPHRKEGAVCPKCAGEIERIKVGGRTTYFCPSCQTEK